MLTPTLHERTYSAHSRIHPLDPPGEYADRSATPPADDPLDIDRHIRPIFGSASYSVSVVALPTFNSSSLSGRSLIALATSCPEGKLIAISRNRLQNARLLNCLGKGGSGSGWSLLVLSNGRNDKPLLQIRSHERFILSFIFTSHE
jgi:hypothetical protein